MNFKKKVTQVVRFWPSFFLKMFYLMGRVGRGTKVSFNFFILRYIKHYTHIYLYTKKYCPDKYPVGLYFGQVGEFPQRFSKSQYYADIFQKCV